MPYIIFLLLYLAGITDATEPCIILFLAGIINATEPRIIFVRLFMCVCVLVWLHTHTKSLHWARVYYLCIEQFILALRGWGW